MTLLSTGGYRSDGRIGGCYVYLLLCQQREAIFVKAGVAQDPIKRLSGILTGCPIAPGILATIHVPNRDRAFNVERAIHGALLSWRARGEWYVFSPADKVAFNTAVAKALSEFAPPSKPFRWTKVNVAELQKDQRSRAWVAGHAVERKAKRGGKAQRDFNRHRRSG